MKKMNGKILTCKRCNDLDGKPYRWISRVEHRPRKCPNCQSKDWDSQPKTTAILPDRIRSGLFWIPRRKWRDEK